MIKYIILAIFFLCNYSLCAQTGNPFIQNFGPASYKNKSYISSPQNWGLVQDNRGIMYISNTSGVLEFDGKSWQLIKGTENDGVFRLCKSNQGKIFGGSSTNLGYLSPDSSGRMQFVSLLPNLNGKYPKVKVSKTLALRNNIYFLTSNHLFEWSGKKFHVWKNKAGFGGMFIAHDKLFLIDKRMGLCVLESGQVKQVPGGKAFSNLDVTALIPTATSAPDHLNFIVATFSHGLQAFQNQELKKIKSTTPALPAPFYFMHGLRLKDGTIALATTSNGIIIINDLGDIKKIIDKSSGLNDNVVLSLFLDREGGLWAGLNVGISRIDYPAPLTYFNETSGLDGIVNTIYKQENYLYAGTSQGLFVLNEKELVPAFNKVSGIQGEVWKVLSAHGKIVIANRWGVYLLFQHKIEKISPTIPDTQVKCIYQSVSNPDKIYVGLSKGMALLNYQKGNWQWAGLIDDIKHEVIYLAEDKHGMLWASCDNDISRLNIAGLANLKPPVQNLRPPAPMVKKVNKFQAAAINGKVYFGTNKGIYSIRQLDGKLQPDSTLGKQFASGLREAINLTEDNKGNIWLTSEFRTGVIRKEQGNHMRWDTIPLVKMPADEDVWSIHADPAGTIWLGTNLGIFRYDTRLPKNYKSRGHTVLRKINLLGDSTVFNGAFLHKGNISLTQSPSFKITLPHAIKSITFEYAATAYDAPDKTIYSYQLEGEDKSWSKWTTETKKEYTGLDEGDYVFKVKSKNLFGTENHASTFEFSSLPPFYRTWWAYGCYIILYGLIIWGFIKIKHRNLIASKKSLEKLVQERTGQLEIEKKKSDDLLLNILPAATAEELKLKGRALARNYETATVLFTDFKDFTLISEHLTPEELVAVIDFYFCAFDRIISKYNIEKIKTIGDAYMCAGGLPNPEANTPADVVKAALEILDFVKRLNPDNQQLKKHKFEIRIGIHSGPVVAGIVGIKKFAYDIWGDTVNTAARMESTGEEGKINISGTTYNLVKDSFHCTYRGKLSVKNKGEIEMYFVEKPIQESVKERRRFKFFPRNRTARKL